VLAVGTSSWYFIYGVSNYLQTSYFNEIKEKVDEISERFAVEHAYYDQDSGILHVWIYNYGKVDIQISMYIYLAGSLVGQNATAVTIPSKSFMEITVPVNVPRGNNIIIEVMSRRQNMIYEDFLT
jgi:hypothetical protein